MLMSLNKSKEGLVERVFTFLVVLYPMLFIYSVGGSSVMVPDLLLCLMWFVLLFDKIVKKTSLNFVYELLPFIFYLLFHILYMCAFDFNEKNFFSSSRFLFYILTIFLWGRSFFLFNCGWNVYKWACVLATIYLFFQSLMFNILHIYIPGYVQNSIFPVLANQIGELERSISQDWVFLLRPSSFFQEPSHYAEYAVIFLGICLFLKKQYFLATFISIGILVSVSSTGILLAFLIWGAMFLSHIKKINISVLVVSFFSVSSLLFFVLNSKFFQIFLERMSEGKSSFGRFKGYAEIVEYTRSDLSSVVFGNGMGDLFEFHSYLAGYARLYAFFGLMGFFFFALFMFLFFKNKKIELWQKQLMVIFLFLNVGTEILFQPMILTVFPFLFLYKPLRESYVSMCHTQL